ncbi:MAG: BLUF domain-containing protein [Rhizobiales bacterium]|nr:BLUF domain-containing protein [Hyphomicrobiales bacterium]
MALIQWVYASAASKSLTTADLDKMLTAARARNEQAGITGILLYHDGSFLQVLEGEEEVVSEIYERIVQDPRHCALNLVFRGAIEARNFGAWSMGFYRPKDAGELPGFVDILRSVTTGMLDLQGRADRVKKLIDGFKDGRWRQKVAA